VPAAKTALPHRRNPVVLVSREPGLGPGLARHEKAVRLEVMRVLRLVRAAGVTPALSVYLCSNRTIARLNRRWFGKSGATNVISFQSPALKARIRARGPVPLRRGSLRGYGAGGPAELPLGDLAISIERARAESCGAGVDSVDWTAALAHHGLMHILGYSHGTMPPRRPRS